MTLLRLKTLAMALCLTGMSYAQTTNAFRINYDIALFDLPIQSSEALTAGNYVFSGFHTNFLPIVSSLTEIDGTGNVLWAKRYSGGISYMFGDYKKDNVLNRYYVCGGSGNGPAFLMFVDAAGNFISGRNFSISQADGAFFNRVIKTADGGYLCVGYVTGYDPDGAGPEVDFNSVTNNDASCSEPDTESIESPLIVKFDASGNQLWHHVVRYYMTSAIPANRIYNDASFVDVVEVSDGYIAVGNYDVNNVYSTFDGECDDTTPTDAVFFKTTTAGAITYHRQIDNPSNLTSQSSKAVVSASLTSTGLPLISGTDGSGRPALLMRLPGSGGWANPTWIRKYGAGNFFGTYYPLLPSRFFETSDGNYGVWLNYINLASFSNVLMKVNSATSAVTFAKNHTFNFASILPHGQQVSDGGYVGISYTLSGAGHDMHFIKTDTNGDAPGACAATNVTVTNETPSYTYGTPLYLTWTGNTVTNTTITPTVTNITPATSVQCSFVPCTPPTAPVVGTITQPTCSVSTGSVALSGLPTPGTWTVTASPGGATITGTGTTANFTGLAPNTYTFTVTLAGCTSVASASAIVTAAPAVPATPVIGTITQTTCSTATGSVALSGLPAGSWTVTASPGGATLSGSGTTGTFTGLAPGTYTFTVAASAGTTTLFSEDFETGGPGWTLNVSTGPEGADANFFQIDDDEGGVAPTGCGVANNNDETLHITSVFNPAGGAAYDAGGLCGLLFCPQADKRAESPAVNSVGQSGLTLNFNYIAKGDIPNDQATVWYNDGTGWYQLGAALNSPICGGGQGQWSAYSSALPASCNNIANLKVAIRWVNNDDGAGTDPSVAINNLTITAAGAGCSSLASTSATINPQPTVPTAPVVGTITQPTCSVSTGSVALSGLPSSGTWTLTASPGGTTSTGTGTTGTFAGLTAGTTYTFTVTNAGGCTSTASTSAAINTAPTAASAPIVGTITQPTCTVSTGSVALSGLPAAGSWTVTASPGGTTTTGLGTTTTFSGLTANTTYTFTVTNASGCTSSASTSALLNAAPTPATTPIVGTVTQPSCSVSTGSVDFTGLPASGTWTITASPGGTTSTGTGTTGTFTGLTAGTTYTFTVTNAGGCTSTASTSAAINTAPTAASAPIVGTITQPTCTVSTGSVALSGLPAAGSWTVTASPGGTTTTGSGTTTTFSGLTANTTYTFTVTNASGCTSSASTSALLNAAPTPATTPIVGTITQPSCSVSTGSVDFTGLPASGTWTLTASPGGTTSTGTGTTGTFAGLIAGTTYTFTVTNAGGCTSTATTSAALNAAPTPASTPITGTITQPTCSAPNGTVDLSGLPASGTWTVTANPGAIVQTGTGTTATFGSLPAGSSYTFTVTNSAGCTSSASTSAAINSVPGAPTSPVLGTITQPTCAVSTGSVDLSGLPSSGTWTLTTTPGGTTTGTGTTTSISGLAAGTSYTFMVTNDLGCTSSSSSSAVIIAQPITPTAPIVGSITQPTCTVATGDVSISGLPSTGTWTITATPGGLTQTGTGTTGTFTGLSANTYTFTVTNSDGCTSTVSSTSATINAQPATPSAPIAGTVTQPTCLSPTGSVDMSGLPSTGTWTLTSTPGGTTQTGTGTTATFNGLAAGTTYTLTVTNSAGCASVSSTSVVVNSVPGAPTAPTAGTVTQPTCALPTGTIEVASPLGANFTYSIDGTTFQAGTTFSGLNPGNYTITVLDNTSGCSSVSAASVTIDPVVGAPTLSLVTSTSVTCIGDTDGALEISVAGGIAPYTYAWIPNVGSGNILTNLAAGSYDVTVTDDAGCSATATFTVGSPTAIAVNGVETNVICGTSDGSIATAVNGGTAPYTYAWTPNSEITSGLTGLAAGNYSVLVTDDNGCTATESFTISTTGSLPIVIDPSYALIDAGETVQLTVTGGQNYTWTPATGLSCTNCPNPIASPTVTTTYYVTATDPNGCTGGDTILIEIKLACGELFVPTAFSPNDKGPSANNTLCVYGTPACIKEFLFQVYDRWGEVVFETTDITKCWDGMYKDKMMNSGIYVYRLYAELTNGDIVDTSGNTTLVR